MLFQFNHRFMIYHLLALQRQTDFKLCLVFAVASFFLFLFFLLFWLLLFCCFNLLFLMKLKYKQENWLFGYCLIFSLHSQMEHYIHVAYTDVYTFICSTICIMCMNVTVYRKQKDKVPNLRSRNWARELWKKDSSWTGIQPTSFSLK